MNPRRLILMTAIVVLGAVPTALAVSADPFGPVEVADPTWRPGYLLQRRLAVRRLRRVRQRPARHDPPRRELGRPVRRLRALWLRAGDLAAHGADRRRRRHRAARPAGGGQRDGDGRLERQRRRVDHALLGRPPAGRVLGRAAGDRVRHGRRVRPVRARRQRRRGRGLGRQHGTRRALGLGAPGRRDLGRARPDLERRRNQSRRDEPDRAGRGRLQGPDAGLRLLALPPRRRAVDGRGRGDAQRLPEHARHAAGRVRRHRPHGRDRRLPRVRRHDPLQHRHQRRLGRDRPDARRRRRATGPAVRLAPRAGHRAPPERGRRGLDALAHVVEPDHGDRRRPAQRRDLGPEGVQARRRGVVPPAGGQRGR